MNVKTLVFGPRKDIHDPHIFHKLSLIAFFAWVGLGADGLSSSAYGPEEAFRALGEHTWMAAILVFLVAATVLIISSGYSRIIEQFPFGGGGYVVSSRILGPHAGVVSGSALLVDYVLTISISIASGADAIFSFLPPQWAHYKLGVELAGIALLTVLNLRGVKESVALLTPIFLTFLVTHLVLIVGGIASHAGNASAIVDAGRADAQASMQTLGMFGLLGLILHAYSMGGGTYTGIEAVSNGLAIMREPKVKTGKRTMLYMSLSLAFTAGGIIACYLLFRVAPQAGKTLNAVLVESFAGGWTLGGYHVGRAFVLLTLTSEALLLFVAAQAGFIDGPRVMANMAHDSWLPHRFGSLSEQLTMHNGVLLMSGAAVATLFYTHGSVSALVVMYSINVFLTFTLSEVSMLVHTLRRRKEDAEFTTNLAVFAVGTLVCAAILTLTVHEKFLEGGWLTLAVTAGLVALCYAIRRHYRGVGTRLRELDQILMALPAVKWAREGGIQDKRRRTAVLLVGGYSGIGIHTLLSVQKTFPNHFENFVFISVGVVDTATFQGVEAVHEVENQTSDALDKYANLAMGLGIASESRMGIGVEVVDTATDLAVEVAKEFPNCVFFAGKLIFRKEGWFQRILHNETAMAIQKRLQMLGLKLVVLPITESVTADVPSSFSLFRKAPTP
jgi:amino acid transporter